MKEFTKPARNNNTLINEWERRGLSIPNRIRAERYLDFIGYYRLSAYTIPFQQTHTKSHQFKTNTSFDDILNLYVFDRELRLLVLDAIERIEVAVRAQISNTLSLSQNNPFWYLDKQYFSQEDMHAKLLSHIEQQLSDEQTRLNRDIQKIQNNPSFSQFKKTEKIQQATQENFLRHYIAHYDKPKLPPCWMMVELLTFGELSYLYSGLKSHSIQMQIGQNLGINAELLTSWLRAFNSIRNFCAHHSRLWNRELGVSIKIPKSKQVKWLHTKPSLSPSNINYQRRIYAILVALQTMLYQISPHSSWAKRLKQLLENYPNISLTNMGIPAQWHTDPFWYDAL